jgi:type IV fimbrial biogenesis protein FimT
MLVTMTVLGLLLLAVLPSAAEWMRNIEIRNAAESVSAGLQKARAEAVRRNQNVLFSLVSTAAGNPGALDASCALSASSASWVISLSSPVGRCNVAPSDTATPQIIDKHAQGDGSPNVRLTVRAEGCSASSSATQIAFNSLGRAATSPTPLRCIDFTHAVTPHTRMRLVIDSGGGVRSCLPDLPASTNDPRVC